MSASVLLLTRPRALLATHSITSRGASYQTVTAHPMHSASCTSHAHPLHDFDLFHRISSNGIRSDVVTSHLSFLIDYIRDVEDSPTTSVVSSHPIQPFPIPSLLPSGHSEGILFHLFYSLILPRPAHVRHANELQLLLQFSALPRHSVFRLATYLLFSSISLLFSFLLSFISLLWSSLLSFLL